MTEKEDQPGHLHPLSITIREVADVFAKLGFEIAEGPEIEDEYHNFDALNVPQDHPSRDMQDTFWIKGKDKTVLRTHTSSVQIRFMKAHKPPFKIIAPGRVFRNEATDATHEAQFYQLEGLVVGKGISMAHLKGTLETLFKTIFGDNAKVRLRSSFFPFVEPAVEVDVSCFKCSGAGCSLCKGTGWIEVMGAGMVHPNVLKEQGIDPREWSGFAFGGGIDRLVMLKYGIDDIRAMYAGDLRFVNQF